MINYNPNMDTIKKKSDYELIKEIYDKKRDSQEL
jgi:hypothetical protein